jgi:hypothetical protein
MALTKKTKQVPKKKFGTKKKTLKRYNKTQKGGGNAEAKAGKAAQRAAQKAAKAEKAAAKAAAAAEASKLFPGNAVPVPKRKTGIFSKFSGLGRLRGLLGPETKLALAPAPAPASAQVPDFLKQITPAEVEMLHRKSHFEELNSESKTEDQTRAEFFKALNAQEQGYRRARLEKFLTTYGEEHLREKLNLGPDQPLDISNVGKLSELSSTLNLEKKLGPSRAPLSVVYNLLTNPEKKNMDELLKSSTNPNDVAEALQKKIETVASKIGGETSARINTLPLELQLKVLQKYYETAEGNKTSRRFRDILAEARAQVPQISYESRAKEGQQFLEAVKEKLEGERFK